jgi:hypothetical protein
MLSEVIIADKINLKIKIRILNLKNFESLYKKKL